MHTHYMPIVDDDLCGCQIMLPVDSCLCAWHGGCRPEPPCHPEPHCSPQSFRRPQPPCHPEPSCYPEPPCYPALPCHPQPPCRPQPPPCPQRSRLCCSFRLPRYRCIERVCFTVTGVEWESGCCPRLQIQFCATLFYLDRCGCLQQLCCNGCQTVRMPQRLTRDLPAVELCGMPHLCCRNGRLSAEVQVLID